MRLTLIMCLSSYYAPVFSCERNNLQIQSTESCKPFTISINIIKKQLSAIGKKKSAEPDDIPRKILNLGGRYGCIPHEIAGYYDE